MHRREESCDVESWNLAGERRCAPSTFVEHGDDLCVGIAGSADRGWVVVVVYQDYK